MSECRVKGCALDAVEVVELNEADGPLLETAVCGVHALDLRAGGKFQFGERGTILMGDSLPLELVDYSIREDGAGQTVTLHLGRGPEITRTVEMRVSSDFVLGDPDDPWLRAKIAHWVDDDSANGEELG